MKILFTGGGTGGHIFPIIALAREIRKMSFGEGFEFCYIGPKDDFSQILFSQEDIKVKIILAGKARRYLNPKSALMNFIDIFFKIPLGFLQAFFYVFFEVPDMIFSKGGYGSLGPVIAGWILQTPIFLHESDICPGLSNKILSHFAIEIFTSFRKTEYFPPDKLVLTGNPIRKEILQGSAKEAEKIFDLTGEKPVILILGGSQGAQKINDTIFNILARLLLDFEIIHQAGDKNFEQLRKEQNVILTQSLKRYYHLRPFLKEQDLKDAYAKADFIISRAGAGTIFEIAALGKPSILIPLSGAAQNHQSKNAYTFAERGGCLVIEEANLSPNFLLERLQYLMSRQGELEKMKKAALEFAKPKAAKVIAEYITYYLTKPEMPKKKI